MIFSDQVNLNGKTHDIIDYEKPAKYIILETFCKKSILNGFYILDLSKKSSFKMVFFLK